MSTDFERLKNQVERLSGIHRRMADAAFPRGGSLRCLTCGRVQNMSTEQGGSYLAKGWPTCCGYTMRLETKST